MTLIVGCDPSSKKIALVWEETVTRTSKAVALTISKASQTMTPEACARAQDQMTWFTYTMRGIQPDDRHAWVETPLVGRSGGVRATIAQAYVGGIIRASLTNAGFVVHDVHVGTWKKEVVGNGNAKKPDVARRVKVAWPKVWNLVRDDGDLTDAAAIALYGRAVLARVPAGSS